MASFPSPSTPPPMNLYPQGALGSAPMGQPQPPAQPPLGQLPQPGAQPPAGGLNLLG